MSTSKFEKTVTFEIAKLNSIKSCLTTSQQLILNAAWVEYVKSGKPISYRSLGLLSGKLGVTEAIGWMDPTLLREDYFQNQKVYQMNIYGALLTDNGESLADLLIKLLEFIKIQFTNNQGLAEIQSANIQSAMKLSDDDLDVLFCLLKLYGLGSLPIYMGGWSQDSKSWQIQIRDEIVDILHTENFSDYLGKVLGSITIRSGPKLKSNVLIEDFIFARKHDDLHALSGNGPPMISEEMINDLSNLTCKDWDLRKLILLCRELNQAIGSGNVYTVAILTRVILDHIPPVFKFQSFGNVASEYGGNGKSFKQYAERLQQHTRPLADGILHSQIRKKERLPTMNMVNFAKELEAVLSEVVRILEG